MAKSEATQRVASSAGDLAGALLMDRLLEVAAAAQEFVSGTSWFRMKVADRPSFERLAVALLALNVSDAAAGVSPKEPE